MRFCWSFLLAATISHLCAASGPKMAGTLALQAAPVLEPAARDGRAGESEHLQSFIASDQVSVVPQDGGGSVLLLRVRAAGAAALRLHIADLRLPEQARLFVYGLNNGAATTVDGPYMGSGPGITGDFWTAAVAGEEAVLEAQFDVETPSDVPFGILEVERASSATEIQAAPSAETEQVLRKSVYRGTVLEHEVVDGWAIYDHDIILGRVDELPEAGATSKARSRDAVAITGSRYRWPNGTVPYVINSLVTNSATILTAISHWNTTMAGVVQLVPRTNEYNYVEFVKAASAGTCSSVVGMYGYGRQIVQVGTSCSSGNLIHEIGHTFGLWHEQTREDRNEHVQVLVNNIQAGTSQNFTQQISDGDDVGPYDFGSVMHYTATSFSANGKPTLRTIPAGIPIGQRAGLSVNDQAAIRLLYPPAAEASQASSEVTTVPVSIISNPANMLVKVDGMSYRTPARFNWTPGSAHTVEAVDSRTTTTAYAFYRWTDGASRVRTIVASAHVPAYHADFVVSYSVIATSSDPAGIVTLSPQTADGFQPGYAEVTLNAAAPAGSCFTSWTGLTTGTPADTWVIANRSYNVKANYQPGSITVLQPVVPAAKTSGSYKVGIEATSGCLWNAVSQASWITVSGTSKFTGSGVVTLVVAANNTGAPRTGKVAITGTTVTIQQQ